MTRLVKDVSDGELWAENEYIRLDISEDGSVSLYDKENGRTYSGLHTFIDDGETGNGWFSERPLSDNTAVSSRGSPTTVEIVRKDELLTAFRVTKRMSVPKRADYSAFCRSRERTELTIVSDITLKKASKAVEFEVTVDNAAEDHRLRVDFPSGISGESYYASQAFDFVKRSRGVSFDGANAYEPEPYEKNTAGIVCLKEGEHGLSFVSRAGIHECAVSKNGVITATLLRCFGRIMFGNIPSEKAQLKGTHTFRYAITTETDFPSLIQMQKSMFIQYSNVRRNTDAGGRSLLRVVGRACVSIVKPSEDGKGVIVRLYNPTDDTVPCEIHTETVVKGMFLTSLDEVRREPLVSGDGAARVSLLPHKIETVYIEV